MKTIVAIALILVVVFGFVTAQDIAPGPDAFSGDLAFEHVADQVAIGSRPTGSPEIIVAGNLILDYLDELGWETSEQWYVLNFGARSSWDEDSLTTLAHWNLLDFDQLLDGYMGDLGYSTTRASGFVAFDQVLIPVRNLVASYGHGDKTIILGAHYDSRLFADKETDPEKKLMPVIGANDGGSGVGVLLELARVISEYYDSDDYTIRLVFFDAEDNGHIAPWTALTWAPGSGYLVGSVIYANYLPLETEPITYMILVDMVGDIDQRFPIESYSNQSAPDLVSAIWDTAAELGYGEQFVSDSGGAIIDDHVPFIQRGIPSVDIIDLVYSYHHTTEDTLDKVSAESLERVGHVLLTFLEKTGVIVSKAES